MKPSFVIILTLIISVSFINCQNAEMDKFFKDFQNFMLNNSKKYKSTNELIEKFKIFKDNIDRTIKFFGRVPTKPSPFMDMTPESFKEQYLTLNVSALKTTKEGESFQSILQQGSWDWGRYHPYNRDRSNYPTPNLTPVPTPTPDPTPIPVLPTPILTPTLAPKPAPAPTPSPVVPAPKISTTVPESWDWRTQGAVGPIKDQGNCGDCWAFATNANIEGLFFIKNGFIKTFSEQQLLDCDNGNGGCNGGMMDRAYQYIQKAGGLVLDSTYPYTAQKGSCRFNARNVAVKLNGFMSAGTTNEDKIKQMLFTVGPLAAVLNATPLQYYSNGIYSPDNSTCPANVNHGVVVVGYGSENGQNYWIVKNSWGPKWGENGYFRIARGTGACGINTHIVSAKLA
jgi:hypothetical protein